MHADRDVASFADEVRAGLGDSPKHLPCRFLYDEAGSLLFERICELPEYYPTRAEREILVERADEIADLFAEPIALAELGSGSSTKTRELIAVLLRRQDTLRYVPVDISLSILEESSRVLLDRYPALEIRAIASEYEEGLRHLANVADRTRLIAWLGSNVGNFDRAHAAAFLGAVRGCMAPRDRLLLGADLRKDPRVLERAYDDAQGVTERFNKNLLARINRELGGGFDLDAFAHRALWNGSEGRMEMHLVSLRAQRVSIEALAWEVELAEGEPIHTENSYKYTPDELALLAAEAKLTITHRWLDSGGLFSLSLLAPL